MSEPWPRQTSAAGSAGHPGAFESAAARALPMLADRVGLRLWVVAGRSGELLASHGVSAIEGGTDADAAVMDWCGPFCAQVLTDTNPVVAADASADPVIAEAVSRSEFVVGSFVGVPLRGPDGRLLGTLCGLDHEAQDPTLEAHLGLVETMGTLLAAVLALETTNHEATTQAMEAVERSRTDALTGVLNRAGWDHAVEQAAERCRAHGRGASVLIVDLDDLKAMNDRFGHAQGDEHIRTLARCLTETARSGDIVARIGGDEFGLLVPDSSPGTAEEVGRRLRERLARRGIGASIGVSECPPGGDLSETWRRADLDMYATKRLGSGESTRPASPSVDLDAAIGAALTLMRLPCRAIRAVVRTMGAR